MFTLLKTCIESNPKLRFVGKVYRDEDRIDGHFGAKWALWHEQNWFSLLEGLNPINKDYYGLMMARDDSFLYWIGLFFEGEVAVPEGFSSFEIPAGDFGVSWVYGKDDIYGDKVHNACLEALEDFKRKPQWVTFNQNSYYVFFERYNCPRFTTPDDKGNVILDYGFFLG